MNGLYAQSITTKQLYSGGVYGQTFEITEYSDGNQCKLLITMSDNKNKNTQVQTFDSTLPTVYYIWSKWFSSPSEYSNAVDASKSFLNYSMNLIYLADIKDICDIAPCCKNLDYSVATTKQGNQFIKKVGITKTISFHTSRHTFGTLIQAATGDIETTKKLMGHKSLKSTAVYADVLTEEKVKAISNTKTVFRSRKPHTENKKIPRTKRTAATNTHPRKVIDIQDNE